MKVAIDIDGVLNMLHEEWAAWIASAVKPGFTVAGWLPGVPIEEQAGLCSLDYLNMVGVFERCAIREGAYEVVRDLAASGCELFTITHCNHAHNWVEKDRWLERHFGHLIPHAHRFVGGAKGLLSVDVLIDDHLKNCDAAWSSGTHPLLFDQPWNRLERPYPRVMGWEGVRKVLL